MPHSHHSHSGQFCKHAKGSLDDVVTEAKLLRFEVYGLTEHVPRYRTVDLYPEEADITLDALVKQFDDFLGEAHRLKDKYASQITLLVGLETEFITDADLDHLDALLERVGPRVEYLVGSVHHVNGIPIDFDLPTFRKALYNIESATEHEAMERFLCAYFDAQYHLLQRFHPEIIGHFDLCRLYNPRLEFYTYPMAHEKIERNVKYAIKYGALFEVNAAAFRKGWSGPYPGDDVSKVILKHGGRFAMSDDSHGPTTVGLNYERAGQHLASLRVAELWYLERSETANAGGRYVRPMKMEVPWWEHGFWQGRIL